MRIPTLIILIAFAHLEAVAQAQRWLSYQPAIVELDGRLITEQKYGPPSFGEEPKTDKKLTVPILVLNEAINIRGTPGDLINGESVMGAKRVQLIFTAGVIPYKHLIGKDVVVKGKLFHSHTGHHFTDVLVDVGSIEEAPCPNAMSQFEINQCIGKLYKRSDQEMNEVYNRILAGLNVTSFHDTSWIDCYVSFVNMANDSFLIDQKRRAISKPLLLVKDSIVPDDGSFEIAEYWKGDAELFGKFTVGGNTVYTHSENLSVVCFEFSDISLIRFHFLRSTTGEGEHIHRQHDIFLAFEVAQLVGLSISGSKCEIRSRVTNFQVRFWRSGLLGHLASSQDGIRAG
jgi:hypothetical protein